MFAQQPQTDASGLEKAIDSALRDLTGYRPDTEEYKKIVDQLSKLYQLQKMVEDFKLQQAESNSKQKATEAETRLTDAEARLKDLESAEKLKSIEHFWKRLSPDTLAIVGGNILGIVLVLGYERAHVWTTKALTNLVKPR